ncbi:MAG: hypothetical protein NDJ90_07375 [Oligoflexia bacterium]|nr:hypothetical protein [Oligoflexia bacterium]
MKITLDDVRKLLANMEPEVQTAAQVLVMELPALSLVVLSDKEGFEEVRAAHSNACARLRLAVPLQTSQSSDFPFLFESRLTPLAAPGLTRLQPQLLDRHDTVVSKILKGDKRDLATIEGMARHSGLTFEALVDSFCAIDTSTVSDFRRVRATFLQLIETLFGANSVTRAEATVAERLG